MTNMIISSLVNLCARNGHRKKASHWRNFISLGVSVMDQMVKNLPASAGDAGSICGLGRSTGGGNDNPLQYSCLESPMDRGAWWATVHGVTESD